MGLRGPQRNPNSRRGRAEAEKAAKLAAIAKLRVPARAKPAPISPATGSPICPDWLSPDQAKLFASLVTDLEAAQVPIKHIDAHAIMMAVQCLSSVKDAGTIFEDEDLEPKDRLLALRLKAQAGKDLQQWLQLICATPGARARIGLKTEAPKKLGPLALMLAAKQGRKA
jgi:phage terminase small subunit